MTSPTSEKPYVKYAWVFLVVAELYSMVSALGFIIVTNYFFTSLPGSEVLGPTATALIRGLSSLWLGMNLFGLAITLKPFRKGEKWAWYTLWYFPIVFFLHFLVLWPLGSFISTGNLPYTILSIPGLVLPYRKFFPKK